MESIVIAFVANLPKILEAVAVVVKACRQSKRRNAADVTEGRLIKNKLRRNV